MGEGTSIGRVRGLGSAHAGAHHWLMQRFTAVGNLVLGVWFAVSLLALPNYSYITLHDWLIHPVPAVALGLLAISSFWHTRLGLQVVAEDYIHTPANKTAVLIALNLATFAGAGFALFAILRLALGA